MKDKINTFLLKTLSGEATREELVLFENWKKEKPEHAEEARLMENLWMSKFHYPGLINSEEEFTKIWNRAHCEEAECKERKLEFDWHIILKIAGVILVFMFVFIFSYYIDFNSNPDDNNVSLVNKSNTRGQKSKIYLEDGTWVWLNSSSKVEYLRTFKEQNDRVLSLSGEAYFEVAKDTLRPFKIQLGLVTIEVLGTMFNANTNDEGRVSIALKEGSVKVNWKDYQDITHEKFLSPGEIIFIDKESGLSVMAIYKQMSIMGWKDGILYFDNASFEHVIKKLQTWYNVDIIAEGLPRRHWNYSGEFDNYVLDNVLKAMSFAEDFKFKIEGDKVKIMFN